VKQRCAKTGASTSIESIVAEQVFQNRTMSSASSISAEQRWNEARQRSQKIETTMETIMRQIILAFAAMLPAVGTTHANDILSNLQFPGADMTSARYGDAAPRSIVKKVPTGLNFSSSASIGAPAAVGKLSSRYTDGDASMPSTVYNAPRALGFSSAASMSASSRGTGLGASSRILYGSN
jgi:hypothetical protein